MVGGKEKKRKIPHAIHTYWRMPLVKSASDCSIRFALENRSDHKIYKRVHPKTNGDERTYNE